ncbi:GxxExxY protein [Candidatus Kaiserbacteria bacterium]|nr:GxxExxY protein [Candidatus Kaiserbacteria bacterium]
MHANDTNGKILYRDLSYRINGLLFDVHNELGRYCREKQYGDALEHLLKEKEITFEREKALPIPLIENTETNKADFVIENSILLELKAKPIVTKEDYSQIQRYLQASKIKLGLLINFRSKYLRPIRIIRFNS